MIVNTKELIMQDWEKILSNIYRQETRSLWTARTGHFRIRPKIGKNQIWSLKSEYIDFLGNKQTTSHPLIVSIITDTDEIEIGFYLGYYERFHR